MFESLTKTMRGYRFGTRGSSVLTAPYVVPLAIKLRPQGLCDVLKAREINRFAHQFDSGGQATVSIDFCKWHSADHDSREVMEACDMPNGANNLKTVHPPR